MPDRCADRLARRLFEAGVRFAFGIPGGEVLVVIDALERAGIRYVAVTHESAGGFMAEAIWHRTGAPGVLVATVGPGLTNAVNVVANAALDRVPLLVLAGCVDEADRLTYTHQVLDHARQLEPALKASFTLAPASADLVTERALRLATDPRPGPVHVDVPIGVAAAPAADEIQLRRGPRVATAPAPGHPLDTARAWLARAERPLVIAGFDAVQDRAGSALAAFAHRLRAPVIQTYKAQGVLAEDDPWALAPAALAPAADRVLLPVVERADAIVLAGYDAVEMRAGWRRPWDPRTKRVVDVTPVPNDHYLHHGSLEIVADVGATLAVLGAALEPSSRWTAQEVAALRERARAPFRPEEDWGPAAVCEVARRVLPRATIATADAGAHRIVVSQLWQCFEPRTLLQSNGLCTMGAALPLAIGAKLAEPARPVAAFVGDGGLLMGLGELATAAERGLAVVVVVFVDRALALIEKKQRELQLAAAGIAVGAVDFPAAARALGGAGETVRDRAGLEAALRRALAADTFTVVACALDRRCYDGRI